MSESTLTLHNKDRIVVRRDVGGWQVTYDRAAPARGRWWRWLLAPTRVFRVTAHSPAEVQAILVRRNIHLSRAECQRLQGLMQRQNIGHGKGAACATSPGPA